jgi:hypothetical protein
LTVNEQRPYNTFRHLQLLLEARIIAVEMIKVEMRHLHQADEAEGANSNHAFCLKHAPRQQEVAWITTVAQALKQPQDKKLWSFGFTVRDFL